MLSPRTIRLMLKYFDSIDKVLTRRFVRRRVWDEEALTFLFTELLDEDGQQDHVVPYPHERLVHDLSLTNEPMAISVVLETHSYPKTMERYVTQSDIGFILSYEDQFNQVSSFRRGWLMQAKRLFPSRAWNEDGFTVHSRFESIDPDQHERMKALRDWAQCEFIRYLLYCPRPSALDVLTREGLCSARAAAFANNIFDFALGLELRDDLLSEDPTVAAGVFVAILDGFPATLLDVHKSLFSTTSPFSWFIVSQLAQINRGFSFSIGHDRELEPDGNLNNPIIEGLIRGDVSVIQQDENLTAILGDAERASILPAHTITIRVINGHDRPRHDNAA